MVIALSLAVMTGLQGISIILLLQYAHTRHETHFIPPVVSNTFSLSKARVSETYLADMTNFLVNLRFNITPNTVKNQFNSLLGWVSPEFYGELRRQLVSEVEQIKHEHLSSAFYPLSLEIDTDKFVVKITGLMKRFVGADLMKDSRETFLIQYSYKNGLLTIKNIEKGKP